MRTAVILAAGMGTRLRGELQDRPKGFLQLGDKPIVEESIERLRGAGLDDVIVVTGYQANFYEALARRIDSVRLVHNPRFADSGSMYSLFCARQAIGSEDFLLLESDLIYEPRAITALLEGDATDAILLSGPTAAGDEVYVRADAGRLVAMSKDPAVLGGSATGELVGISRISAPLFAVMQRIAAKAFDADLNFDYETDCLVRAGAERAIACPLLSDLVWAEIDDPSHLSRARERVYPEILRRTAPAGRLR